MCSQVEVEVGVGFNSAFVMSNKSSYASENHTCVRDGEESFFFNRDACGVMEYGVVKIAKDLVCNMTLIQLKS